MTLGFFTECTLINFSPTCGGTTACHCLVTLASSFSGPDNLDNLRRLAEQFQKGSGAEGGASAAAQDDDDVPELVPGETFEEAAEEKKAAEPEEKKES
jgi:hypothetical protein